MGEADNKLVDHAALANCAGQQLQFEIRRLAVDIEEVIAAAGYQHHRTRRHHIPFGENEFDVVICSKLKRAIQTAEYLISDRKLPIIHNDLCNERDYGKMQGLTYVEVEDINPRILYLKMNSDFHSLNPPGGEDFPALRKRAMAFSKHLFETYAGSNVLVVSHSAFMQQLHGIFRGFDWIESLRYDIHNLACYSFTFEGKRLIESMPANLLIGNW